MQTPVWGFRASLVPILWVVSLTRPEQLVVASGRMSLCKLQGKHSCEPLSLIADSHLTRCPRRRVESGNSPRSRHKCDISGSLNAPQQKQCEADSDAQDPMPGFVHLRLLTCESRRVMMLSTSSGDRGPACCMRKPRQPHIQLLSRTVKAYSQYCSKVPFPCPHPFRTGSQ